jgi:hypothetical protein
MALRDHKISGFVLLFSLLGGEALTIALMWGENHHYSLLELVLIYACGPFAFAEFVLLPYGVMVLGAMRLRKRRAELEAMDDTLADVEPEVADRKLREYVAARQGLEARIGLVERTHAHDMANATHTLPDDDPRGLPRVQS